MNLDESRVRRIWNRAVIPYLEEQCFGDDDRLKAFNFDALNGKLAEMTAEEVSDPLTDGVEQPPDDSDDAADA